MKFPMRIFSGITLSLLILGLASCNPNPPKHKQDANQLSTNGGEASGVPLAKDEFGVGDVEAALSIEIKTDDKSKTDAVKEEETLDMRKRLVLDAVDVSAPAPKELWVNLTLKSTSSFTEGLVVARVKVFREKDEVYSFAQILGKDVRKSWIIHSFDALVGLQDVPKTMLINAQAEVVLLPSDTDPASIDPKTVTADANSTGVVLSNPMRINFASGV
jgi:hypothetical protein